jgi:protein-S-isoprenylcysteine O-methyltransferase Ste14
MPSMLVVTGECWSTGHREEERLGRSLGSAYGDYASRVPRHF